MVNRMPVDVRQEGVRYLVNRLMKFALAGITDDEAVHEFLQLSRLASARHHYFPYTLGSACSRIQESKFSQPGDPDRTPPEIRPVVVDALIDLIVGGSFRHDLVTHLEPPS